MKIAIRRYLGLSDVIVSGALRYKDNFQILPADKEAPRPPAVLNHHPFIFEIKFQVPPKPVPEIPEIDVPDWVHENDIAAQEAKNLLSLLTVFSSHRLFQYKGKQSWFMPMGTKTSEPANRVNCQWGQESYFYEDFNSKITDFTDSKANPIEFEEAQKYFNRYGRHTDQQFDLPDNITTLFDAYFDLTEDAPQYFLSACSLFNQGIEIWSSFPSLSFAAFVSALETLIAYDHKQTKIEKCKECGQDRYRVVKKFRDFFGSYGSPDPNFKKYALKIYKTRSKILHRGELFIGDVYQQKFGMHDWNESNFRRSIISTARICLVNWLLLNGKRTATQPTH